MQTMRLGRFPTTLLYVVEASREIISAGLYHYHAPTGPGEPGRHHRHAACFRSCLLPGGAEQLDV